MSRIPRHEFSQRIARIQEQMGRENLDALMVYGDEYRKENLRYVSNFWPIFERCACFIPRTGDPVLAGAPEGEKYAAEMCPWPDRRLVPDFACVSVAEEIEYPLATFTRLRDIVADVLRGGTRLGMVGLGDVPMPIYERLRQAVPGEIVDAGRILNELRLIKSPAEIECLRAAGSQACVAYRKLIEMAVPGNTELQAAGAAEGAARMAGAEAINFTVFGSGRRADTIIGRGTEKVICDGDMIMAAIAVQYEGYVATAEFPFVAGVASDGQKRFLAALFEAADVQLRYLTGGARAGDMVRAVKDVFRRRRLDAYDVYPPMHGIGLAEAELPYPNETSDYPFRAGMCVNSDISLFGHPDGSNRIEEGFAITDHGPESLTPYIRERVAAAVRL